MPSTNSISCPPTLFIGSTITVKNFDGLPLVSAAVKVEDNNGFFVVVVVVGRGNDFAGKTKGNVSREEGDRNSGSPVERKGAVILVFG